MSFIDCLVEQAEKGLVSKSKIKELEKERAQLIEKFVKNGNTQEGAASAAEKIISVKAQIAYQRALNDIRQVKKLKDIKNTYNKINGPASYKVGEVLQRISDKVEAVENETFVKFNKIFDMISPRFSFLVRNHYDFNKAVIKVIDQEADDEASNAISGALQYLLSRYRQAGGIIGEIKGFFPTRHRRERIVPSGAFLGRAVSPEERLAAKDEWSNFLFNSLDVEGMIDGDTGMPFDPDKLMKVIRQNFDDIDSDNYFAKTIDEGSAKVVVSGKRGDIELKRTHARFYKFKSGQAWMDYNNKYGDGEKGTIDLFLTHAKSLSKDIAIMEGLGPRPKIGAQYLINDLGVKDGMPPYLATFNKNLFSMLMSSGSVSEKDMSGIPWKIYSGTSGLQRAALLGGTLLSSVSDLVFSANTARLNGLSATRTMVNHLAIFAGSAPLTGLDKSLARAAGFTADIVNGATMADARFSGDITKIGGSVNHLFGLINTFSGLALWTRSTKLAVTVEGLSSVARYSRSSWTDLPKMMRESLSQYGMTKETWESAFLNDSKFIGDDYFINYGPLQMLNIPKLRAEGRNQFADSVEAWIYNLRGKSSNEGNLVSRGIVSGGGLVEGGGKPGQVSRISAGSVFMFKNFLISAHMNHIMPEIRRIQADGASGVMKGGLAIGGILAGTTLVSAMIIQLHNLLKGKTFEDWDNPQFWRRSAARGGGATIFSDLLFPDLRWNDNDLLGSPMFDFGKKVFWDLLIKDGWKAFDSLFDEDSKYSGEKHLAKAFKTLEPYVPFSNLFYFGPAFDRTFSNAVQQMLDPDFDKRLRRAEKSMLRESNQEFWWRPGESFEDSDPELIKESFDEQYQKFLDLFKEDAEGAIPPQSNNSAEWKDQAASFIAERESLSLEPYEDEAGVATIGYGTTVYPNGERVQMGDAPITEKEATDYFNRDIEKFTGVVESLVKVDLTDKQKVALASLVYNIGDDEFKRSKILSLLNSGDLEGAAEEFERWNKVKEIKNKKWTGRHLVSRGLTRRRQEEKELFISDISGEIQDTNQEG